MKQFVLYLQILNCMHIQEVIDLLKFLYIFPFLEFDTNYNYELFK